ncbi:MAG: hypothetical protein Q8R33_15520 [Burkholderiales bacterium]|nr:hypothetical protein [Burkholderiales bacterium]
MSPNEMIEVLLQRVAALEARVAQLEALPAALIEAFEIEARGAAPGDSLG